MSLYTVGYENRTLAEFTAYLKNHGISTLVDVREIPLSRKKGFSKTALSKHLEDSDIHYIHFKELGSPKQLRHKVREDGDFNYFFSEYSGYIKTKQQIIAQLHHIVSEGTSCVMCYEASSEYCHRRVVADEVKKHDGNGLKIEHI